MAQEGRAPFRSAWAANDAGIRDLIGLCSVQPREPQNIVHVWKTWFLGGITVVAHTATLSDTIGGGGGGGSGWFSGE